MSRVDIPRTTCMQNGESDAPCMITKGTQEEQFRLRPKDMAIYARTHMGLDCPNPSAPNFPHPPVY